MTPSLRLVPAPADPVRCPRLRRDRALAWRSPTSLQVGSDPAGALVLSDLDAASVALVHSLDGSRRTDELLAEGVVRGGDPAALQDLLDRLGGAGLLAGADPSPPALAAEVRDPAAADGDRALAPRRAATVVVHGGGRVAASVACLLAAAGVGAVVPRAGGLVAGGDTGTGLLAGDVGRARDAALADALTRVAPTVRTTVPGRRRPDLVLLADGEVVDPGLSRRLVAARRPHLPVCVREGVGLVGPLVLPGRSGCLRCVEARRAAADPAWPVVAAQLTRWVAPAPVAVATATAAVAVEQVLAVLDAPVAPGRPAPPPALGAVLEVDPRGARMRTRGAPARPSCGCVPTAPTGRGDAAGAAQNTRRGTWTA